MNNLLDKLNVLFYIKINPDLQTVPKIGIMKSLQNRSGYDGKPK